MAVWSVDTSVYMHGGFEHVMPNIPISTVSCIDAAKLFANHPNLAAKMLPKAPRPERESREAKKAIRKNRNNLYNIDETQEFHLATQAHIGTSLNPEKHKATNSSEDFSLMVRHISIDKLQEEARKLSHNGVKLPSIQKNQNEELYAHFITELLKPKEGQVARPAMHPFQIEKERVLNLISEVEQIFQAQPMLISNLKPPAKIFGNINGNYIDLMRFFDIWKAPDEAGDIDSNDYIFLGNYVGRGCQNLEVLCLLLALKLKYPRQIFLLRGSHEDRNINKDDGFGSECA